MGDRQKITSFNQYYVNGVVCGGGAGSVEMDLVTQEVPPSPMCFLHVCDPIGSFAVSLVTQRQTFVMESVAGGQ